MSICRVLLLPLAVAGGAAVVACDGGEIMSVMAGSTGITLQLTAEDDGLALNGTPLDSHYRAVYPNPDRLSHLDVELLTNGMFATTCSGASRCSDPPFASYVERTAAGTRLRVRDLFGKLVVDVTMRHGQDQPPGTGTITGDTPDDVGEGSTTPTPSGSGDTSGGVISADGGGNPPGDVTPPAGSCADWKQWVCDTINAAIQAHHLDYVLDCSQVIDGLWMSPVQPSHPSNMIPCHDLSINPVVDQLKGTGQAGVTCAPAIMNWASNANLLLINNNVCLTSPLVVDLSGRGVQLTAPADGARFDLAGRGVAQQCAWPAGGTAFLVMDRNGNGLVDDGTELFGDCTAGRTPAHGFAALAELDENQDGIIDTRDGAFASLRLWLDADGDGLSTASELLTLAEAGIESLAVSYVRTAAVDRHGNLLRLQSHFTRDDGSRGQLVDAYLGCAP